mgnify:FL=1
MVAQALEDMDKTIEVMKAAMEKERLMKSMENKENKEEEEKDMQNNDFKANAEDTVKTDNTAQTDMKVEAGQDQAWDEMKEADISESSEESDNADNQDNPDMESENEAEVGAAEASEAKSKGKGFFKSSKSKELEAKEAKIAELTDRLMRTMAEFDNYRKRTEKEKSMMFDLGVKSLLEKILPVVDNFERGLSSVSEEDKSSSFVQGIELIYRQLMTILDEIGLKPIEAVGKEFDPNLHNAVMHGEDENLGPNIVAEEFQKGYTYRDMVVRHSMVKVVN